MHGLPAREEFVEHKLDLFGSGEWSSLFQAGPYPALVGKELAGLRIGKARSNDPVFALDGGNFFRSVDLGSSFLLCLIRGKLEFSGENRKPFHLAIAVNGVIRATTRTSPVLDGNRVFTGMVDPSSFVDGLNRVEAFLIEEKKTIRISAGWGGEALHCSLKRQKGEKSIWCTRAGTSHPSSRA